MILRACDEVVSRRYRRLREEGKALPDLVLVDGGIGQLHAAAAALEELDLPTQPLASIAKREEIIYVQGSEEDPIVLEKHSPALRLIQQIRDETHRFAVTFHRLRRTKRTLTTDLLKIPGIGEKTSKVLLRKFGSLKNMRDPYLSKNSQKPFHRRSLKKFLTIFTRKWMLSNRL